jgi:glycosyltransferase involved in cell wall biosynthesis
MTKVRVHGDPFGDDAAASRLRSFLRLCAASGVRCSLALAHVASRAVQPGERAVALTDGVRDFEVGTRLPPAELELVLRAANGAVPATAPVMVFAPPARRADAVHEAGLTWRRASAVLAVRDGSSAEELLQRVRAELRWAGTENPPHALDERELAPWLALPPVAAGPIVCVVDDAEDDGADLAIAAWLSTASDGGAPRLRLVVTGTSPSLPAALRALLGEHAHDVEIVVAAFGPPHVCDASAVLLPWRRAHSQRTLALALASGRPVAASRFAATAALLDAPGSCLPIGGAGVPDAPGRRAHFAPHPAAIAAALREALDPRDARSRGRRARAFVVEELTRDRPASPPPRVPASAAARPVLVLEAPLFETSSSAELTIETARALCRRGRVDLRLVPSGPARSGLAALRARAPELVPHLCRDPGDVDLWLSAGWPVRAARPPCRTFALRVDQEYGALARELTPHVTQDADLVVVHSEHVRRTLIAAGRSTASIDVVPHGVDEAMHEHAPPDAAIVAWKQQRPAVLFCGGMIWRKGFDVFVRAALAVRARGADVALVVKAVGGDQHYAQHQLGELLERVRATPGTPPVFVVERELTRRELAGVYTACDVLLHPYRGEGFCLPVLEARACGLPVLATAGGATDPLMSGPGALRIPSQRRELELPAPHTSQAWVLEPSPDAAADLLAATLADLANARRDARSSARAVRAAYTWDLAAQALEGHAFAAAGKRRARRAGEPVLTLPPAPARSAVPSVAPEPEPAAQR